MAREYSRGGSRNVKSAMRRRKRGTLKRGKGRRGGKVKTSKQAIAVGLSEARKKGKQEKELVRAEEGLEEGKKVLRAAKKKMKKANGSDLERANAKRTLKTIEKGVELTVDRRDLLRKQVEEDEAGGQGGD